MIIGYGTSHDAGIAAVDARSGRPLFAASLERLTRIKNDWDVPLAVLDWLTHDPAVGSGLGPWTALPIQHDDIYRADRGFHALEKHAGNQYRWTARVAEIVFDPPLSGHDCLILQTVRRNLPGIPYAAIVSANGRRLARVDARRKQFHRVALRRNEPLTRIAIESEHVFSTPEDPRELGIMLCSLVLGTAGPAGEKHRVVAHAASEAPVTVELWRLLHSTLVALPRRRLRTPAPRAFLWQLLSRLKFLLQRGGGPYASRALLSVSPYGMSGAFDHHMAHAASAYYPSGLDKALVLTVDGMGSFYSCRVLRGEAGRLQPLWAVYFQEFPVGINYETIVAILGFAPLRHAGKVTGLAAFGKDNPDCDAALDDLFRDIWGRENREAQDWYHVIGTDTDGPEGEVRLALRRRIREERFGRFSREDIAYAIQKRTETEVCALIRTWRERQPDLENIVLAGGVFGNVKLNQRIHEMGFRNVFVQPAMSDAGLCLGAALLEAARRNGGALRPFRLDHVFLGVEFSDDEIHAEMERSGAAGRHVAEPEIAREIAQLLADGKVVAHFHGRMEFGPRALGNRSILYRADDPAVNDWLNKRLQRTEFMPFAPAVLPEAADAYFAGLRGAEHTAEFMTITFDCTEKARREIPAAVHVDHTARPQIVTERANPRFHAILREYAALTGVPAVINTSFNMHEEPIVATPADALRCYRQGHLDVLVLGNYIIQETQTDRHASPDLCR